MTRDATIIALKLKGFMRAEVLGNLANMLTAEGLAVESKMGLRLSPAGREAASAVWAGELAAANAAALEGIYAAFNAVNAGFKSLVTDWQIKNGELNDHQDAAYDEPIIARLGAVHADLLQILTDASAQVPRLTRYAQSFENALDKLKAGETCWMAAPIIDSYHTLWFELHEELIQLTGRTRAAEAAAGHAA